MNNGTKPTRYVIEAGIDGETGAPFVKLTDNLAPFTPMVFTPEDAAGLGQGLLQATIQIFQGALQQCVAAQQAGPRIIRPGN